MLLGLNLKRLSSLFVLFFFAPLASSQPPAEPVFLDGPTVCLHLLEMLGTKIPLAAPDERWLGYVRTSEERFKRQINVVLTTVPTSNAKLPPSAVLGLPEEPFDTVFSLSGKTGVRLAGSDWGKESDKIVVREGDSALFPLAKRLALLSEAAVAMQKKVPAGEGMIRIATAKLSRLAAELQTHVADSDGQPVEQSTKRVGYLKKPVLIAGVVTALNLVAPPLLWTLYELIKVTGFSMPVLMASFIHLAAIVGASTYGGIHIAKIYSCFFGKDWRWEVQAPFQLHDFTRALAAENFPADSYFGYRLADGRYVDIAFENSELTVFVWRPLQGTLPR